MTQPTIQTLNAEALFGALFIALGSVHVQRLVAGSRFTIRLPGGAPDVIAFLGWEWTQVGLTPKDHYGHKNVIFRDLDDDARFAEMRMGNLPAWTAAAVTELSDYEWRSSEARDDYERIKDLLGRELLDQRFGNVAGRTGYNDRIKWRILRPSLVSIAALDVDPIIPLGGKHCARVFGQLGHDFDAVDLRPHFSKNGGLIAGACADLAHLVHHLLEIGRAHV